MKYLTIIFLVSFLSGCSGYVDDPSELIKRLKECESVGMKSQIVSTINQDVGFQGCVPRSTK
jgi:PBP1b-binding outer membrane lipoprotein LpoB